MSHNHSFKFFVWVFIYLTILSVHYCGIVDFWRRHVAFIFHIFYVSSLVLHTGGQVIAWRF
jgi:hypothetical protein